MLCHNVLYCTAIYREYIEVESAWLLVALALIWYQISCHDSMPSWYDTNFIFTPGTGGCHYDKLRCRLLSGTAWHPIQFILWHIGGLVQERRNSIANALELRLYCTSQSIYKAGLIPGLRLANERRRYFVTTSLIGWAQAWNRWCAPEQTVKQTIGTPVTRRYRERTVLHFLCGMAWSIYPYSSGLWVTLIMTSL